MVVSEKVLVVLDVKNLLRVCKSLFGSSYRVDYKKVLEAVISNCKVNSDIHATAYVSLSRHINPADVSFAAAMGKMGYMVKKQTMFPRVRIGIDILSEADWLPGITTDILEKYYEDEYNHFVIITGDNDFRYTGNMLIKKGARVGVYTFSYSNLYEGSASYVTKLNRTFVFSSSRKYREEEYEDAESDEEGLEEEAV